MCLHVGDDAVHKLAGFRGRARFIFLVTELMTDEAECGCLVSFGAIVFKEHIMNDGGCGFVQLLNAIKGKSG